MRMKRGSGVADSRDSWIYRCGFSSDSPEPNANRSDEMRPEYDFSEGVRGKHCHTYRAGTNVMFLEADVAEVFPDSASVNNALRLLVKLAQTKGVVGGQPNKALQPTSRQKRKAKSKRRSRAARD